MAELKKLLSALILLAACVSLRAETNVVSRWLSIQTNIQTWSADFKQERHLKALTQPLVSTGQVWFAAPQNFRWELGGKPPQTIALRSGENMFVIYPRLKRAEKYSLAGPNSNQWKDTLALLQTGFPRSESELIQQFKINSTGRTNDLYQLVLEPKAAGAKKMLPQVRVLLSTNNFSLAGTELTFADGSRMLNLFYNVQTNQPPPTNLFEPNLGPDFKIVEPLKTAK